jgi:pimeloyl-ACP methyl ester carboxylesterase
MAQETVTSVVGARAVDQHEAWAFSATPVGDGRADHSRWKPVLPAFEEHFTVYAIDRRGRGDNGDSEVYSIEWGREPIDSA